MRETKNFIYLNLLVYYMEEDKKIKLPKPLHVKKIHSKLDLLSEKNIIRQWTGYDIVDTLFYLYLFNKYKNNCLIKTAGITSTGALGLELHVMHKILNKQIYREHLETVSKQISQCIGRNVDSIIIPMYLKMPDGGHANLLIYRKNDNTIEHFEPHGSYYLLLSNKKINNLIELRLKEFISILNKQLKKDKNYPVKLIPSNDVCPFIKGLQALEETSSKKKIPLEGEGYCAAWSMFFTELALKNPTIPSNELLNIIYNKLDKDPKKQADYLRQVITGYVNLIHDKIEKYFHFITGTQGKIDNIIEMIKEGQYHDIIFDFYSIVNIQYVLLNNPSLTKKKYLELLEYHKKNITDPNKIIEINREINILNRMDLILSPSPVSSLSKTKSKSKQMITKRKTRTRKNIKTKDCPEGSKMNLETGRCNKIKVYPPCPPTRDPITHRCKAIVEK